MVWKTNCFIISLKILRQHLFFISVVVRVLCVCWFYFVVTTWTWFQNYKITFVTFYLHQNENWRRSSRTWSIKVNFRSSSFDLYLIEIYTKSFLSCNKKKIISFQFCVCMCVDLTRFSFTFRQTIFPCCRT